MKTLMLATVAALTLTGCYSTPINNPGYGKFQQATAQLARPGKPYQTALKTPFDGRWRIGHGDTRRIAVWDLDDSPRLGQYINTPEFYLVSNSYPPGTLLHVFSPDFQNRRGIVARVTPNAVSGKSYLTHEALSYLGCYKSCQLWSSPVQPGLVLNVE